MKKGLLIADWRVASAAKMKIVLDAVTQDAIIKSGVNASIDVKKKDLLSKLHTLFSESV